MKFDFQIRPEEGKIRGVWTLQRQDRVSNRFYLNRSFVIDQALVDGQEVNLVCKQVTIPRLFDYKVACYDLPLGQEVKITYTGVLDGSTGSTPYAKETIGPNFSLLRFETFCYPLFCTEEMNYYTKQAKGPFELTVRAPSDYVVLSNLDDVHNNSGNQEGLFNFEGSNLNISAAIGIFKSQETPLGTVYLQEDKTDLTDFIDQSAQGIEFLNQTFGERNIRPDQKIVGMEASLGSYVQEGIIFMASSAFGSPHYLSHFIHEYAHLGWNPKADGLVQRCRFFDEAITCYMEDRVMEHLKGLEYKDQVIKKRMGRFKDQWAKLEQAVAIREFGAHELGDLSYTIGAYLIHQLEDQMGRTQLDKALTQVIDDFHELPIDFEHFVDVICLHSDKEDTRSFVEACLYEVDMLNKWSLEVI